MTPDFYFYDKSLEKLKCLCIYDRCPALTRFVSPISLMSSLSFVVKDTSNRDLDKEPPTLGNSQKIQGRMRRMADPQWCCSWRMWYPKVITQRITQIIW